MTKELKELIAKRGQERLYEVFPKFYAQLKDVEPGTVAAIFGEGCMTGIKTTLEYLASLTDKGIILVLAGQLPEKLTLCPRCKSTTVQPRDSETYCEECGWPSEDFDADGPSIDVHPPLPGQESLNTSPTGSESPANQAPAKTK